MSDNKLAFFLIAGISATAAALAIAIAYGLYIFWFLVAAGCIAVIRFGIMPILSQGVDIFNKSLDVKLKIRAAQYYALLPADSNGNYAQPLQIESGQLINYIAPGNAIASQINKQESYNTTVTELPEEETLQISGPGINPETCTAPSFRQELIDGSMEAGSPPVYGYRIAVDEFTNVASLEAITDAYEATAFLTGASTVGKSSLIASLMVKWARYLEEDVAFLVFDPHKANLDRSITARILPALDAWIITPPGGSKITGKKPEEISAAVTFLNQQIDLRLVRDDLSEEEKRAISPWYGKKIVVIIDECLSYARDARLSGHDKALDELIGLMQAIATETAKAGIVGFYMSQLSTKEQLGSVDIRDACPVKMVLRVPYQQGLAIGLLSSEARAAERFPKGRGYYKSFDGYERFVWSYASEEDINAALAGINSPSLPGRNKIVNLVSKSQRFNNFNQGETSPKEDRNEIETRYPAALQARLDQIENWAAKVDTLHSLIGRDRRDIFQALFNRAPGGANNAKYSAEYDVLLEAFREDINRLKQASNGGY